MKFYLQWWSKWNVHFLAKANIAIVNYDRLCENKDVQKKIRKITEYPEQVEHTKDELKQYNTMGTVWRHLHIIQQLKPIVDMCCTGY